MDSPKTWNNDNRDKYNALFKNVYFYAQAEFFYFSAYFILKIFLFTFLDYRVLYFIRIADMSILCLVQVFIVLSASLILVEKVQHIPNFSWLNCKIMFI